MQLGILGQEQATFETGMYGLYGGRDAIQLFISLHGNIEQRRFEIGFPAGIAVAMGRYSSCQGKEILDLTGNVSFERLNRTALTGSYDNRVILFHLHRSQIGRGLHQTGHIAAHTYHAVGAGIESPQQGNGTLRISYCVSDGTLYHAGGTAPVVTAEKNCSGIVGGYVSTADAIISRCYARFEEHNADYDVSVIDDSLYNLEAFWANVLGFDIENIWQYNTEAPYVTLR